MASPSAAARVCPDCGGRFTTFERVQLRELMVVKKSGPQGALRPRQASLRSVEIALRKRNVDPERVERAVSGIVRQLESSGESDVNADEIGRLVMEALKGWTTSPMCASPRSIAIFARPATSTTCLGRVERARSNRIAHADRFPAMMSDRRFMAAAIRLLAQASGG